MIDGRTRKPARQNALNLGRKSLSRDSTERKKKAGTREIKNKLIIALIHNKKMVCISAHPLEFELVPPATKIAVEEKMFVYIAPLLVSILPET